MNYFSKVFHDEFAQGSRCQFSALKTVRVFTTKKYLSE